MICRHENNNLSQHKLNSIIGCSKAIIFTSHRILVSQTAFSTCVLIKPSISVLCLCLELDFCDLILQALSVKESYRHLYTLVSFVILDLLIPSVIHWVNNNPNWTYNQYTFSYHYRSSSNVV